MRTILFVLLLTGCVSAEEQQRRAALQQQYQAQQDAANREAYRSQVFAQCRAYGYAEGTEAFKQCLMQVDMANRQAADQQRAILLQQILTNESAGQQNAMPFCSSLPPGTAGYARAQGRCR